MGTLYRSYGPPLMGLHLLISYRQEFQFRMEFYASLSYITACGFSYILLFSDATSLICYCDIPLLQMKSHRGVKTGHLERKHTFTRPFPDVVSPYRKTRNGGGWNEKISVKYVPPRMLRKKFYSKYFQRIAQYGDFYVGQSITK